MRSPDEDPPARLLEIGPSRLFQEAGDAIAKHEIVRTAIDSNKRPSNCYADKMLAREFKKAKTIPLICSFKPLN